MAKSAFQRAYTRKMQNKWLRLLKSTDPRRDLKCLSFGKVFSTDPFDCGSPQCPLCSYGKVFHPKLHRIENRKAEQQAVLEIIEGCHEIETTEP